MTYTYMNDETSYIEDGNVVLLDEPDSFNVTYYEDGQNTYDNKAKRYSNVYKKDIADEFKNMQENIMREQTPILTKLLDESVFDSGYESAAEKHFNYLYNEFGLIADTILLNIYLKNMYENIYLLKHLLFIVANLPEDRRNNLVIIPLAGISNPDIEIQDLSVRCFEIWEDKRHIPTLNKLSNDIQVGWFKEYVEEVIRTLEEG